MYTIVQNHRVASHLRLGIGLALVWGWGSWASGQVVINEIHYDPEPDTSAEEFIELHNAGSLPVDLGAWRFTEGVDYTFPDGTTLPAGAYLVIAENPAVMLSQYGITALGPWTGNLQGDGETVTLRNASGNRIDEVDYGRGFPWPVCPDGQSMELMHPSLDNDLGGSWRSSGVSGDTNQVTYLEQSAPGWRFFKGTSEPPAPGGADWRSIAYTEEASWLTGQATIGYGDSDDNTLIDDMRNVYSSLYFRHTFTIAPGEIPARLLLRAYIDDGCIININGTEVQRWYVSGGDKAYNDLATNHESEWLEALLNNPAAYLVEGTNVVAVHGMQSSLGSSDFSFNLSLQSPPPGGSGLPSPGDANHAFAIVAPPHTRQVQHRPEQPIAGEAVTVTAKVTDPDGVSAVKLYVQAVTPGDYIRLTTEAYDNNWTEIAMNDAGTGVDLQAGDATYSGRIPASYQQHRHLLRYRISVEDGNGQLVVLPYADDPSPNFAYFCYDGVPAWTGASRPGVSGTETFSAPLMQDQLPVYHLVANATDVERCQYNSGYDGIRFYGTLVYDGKVYDHIQFRNRGEVSTYRSGKNKWRLYFTDSHEFEARDQFGKKFSNRFRRFNLDGCSSPWVPANRGMAGNDEAVSHRLYELAGVPSPKTIFMHYRVIDAADEAPADQYAGDLWGLYLVNEYADGRFLDERGLPDGNTYQVEGGGGNKINQGATHPEDTSDWNTFKNYATNSGTALSWWQDNLDLQAYYSFRGINRITANIDIREASNYGMYHHPDGHWAPIPQDLDMMFIPETHWGGDQSYMYRCLVHSELNLDFRNRCREMIDLLFSDASPHGGQGVQVIHEMAHFVNPPGAPLTWSDVDQFMWNYHPKTAGDHKGKFYVTPMNDSRSGGSWTRTLSSPDYEGFVAFISDFITDTDPDGWSVGDGDQRGYGYNYLAYEAQDADIPDRPVITYTGPAGYPVDALQVQSSVFSDPNGSGTFGAMQWRIGRIRNPSTPDYLPGDRWKYEIEELWTSEAISPFNAQHTLPPADLKAGAAYRIRVRHQDTTGRWSHWSEPLGFIAGPPEGLYALGALVISEVHYHPTDFNDYQFIEFKNVGPTTLNLAGVELTDGVEFTFPAGTQLESGSHLVVVEEVYPFNDRYRVPTSPFYYAGIQLAGAWTGSLDSGGEQVVVKAPGGAELTRFTFRDSGDWPERADGRGSSLEIIDPAAIPFPPGLDREVYLNNGIHWRSSRELHGSPGRDGQGGGQVLIHETLTHSDAAPGLDWVELHNPTGADISTTGLYLSDRFTNLAAYALSGAAASIPAGGYLVVDETQLGFALSELGDELVLTEVLASSIGFLDSVDFGASDRDRTFGRHLRSDGEADFTAMSTPSPAAANAYPEVGPIVVSEIMYHPLTGEEWVELVNISGSPVPLYHSAHPTNTWSLSTAVAFTFPGGVLVNPGEAIVVSGLDPATFRAATGLDPSVQVFGPWSGALNNAGDTLRLSRPGDPEPDGFVPTLLTDKVAFRPDAPWPTDPNGTGPALARSPLYGYGNDPVNWTPSLPGGTPGQTGGMTGHMTVAGRPTPEGQVVSWPALPGQRYGVEFRDNLATGSWLPLQEVVADAAWVELLDSSGLPPGIVSRYYRVTWKP